MKITDPMPDWAMLVMWRSKLFMTTYMEIIGLVSTNLTVTSVEALIWKFNLLKNILIELKLITEDDKNKPLSIFQRISKIRK